MSEIVFVKSCVIFVDHVHIVAHGTQEFVKKRRQPSYRGLPPAEASYVRSAVIFIFFYTGLLKLSLIR